MEIKEIVFFYDKKIGDLPYHKYEGYCIKTDKKDFYIAIDNSQKCCEDYGSICSDDNFDYFIGSKILDYRCVDDANYDEIKIKKEFDEFYIDVFDCAFIEFKTTKGDLQFAVYNNHNGYYGHDIKIFEIDK